MNISTSESSSGCESGWTTYLNPLSNSINIHNKQNYQEKGGNVNDGYEEAEEDLSMVSDASSGPPNLHDSYGYEAHSYGYQASIQQEQKKSKKMSKTKETRMMKKKQHSLCFDDTASSPFLHYSQSNAVPDHEIHNSISTSHHEEEIMPRKNVGFFKSSTKGKSVSLQGRKRQ